MPKAHTLGKQQMSSVPALAEGKGSSCDTHGVKGGHRLPCLENDHPQETRSS